MNYQVLGYQREMIFYPQILEQAQKFKISQKSNN